MKPLGPRRSVEESFEQRLARLQAKLADPAIARAVAPGTGGATPLSAARPEIIHEIMLETGATETDKPLAETVVHTEMGKGVEAVRAIVEGGRSPTLMDELELVRTESVIFAIERTSWSICKARYVPIIRPIPGARDTHWRDMFESERDRTAKVARAVALIRIEGAPIGTGWLAAADTLVTNAHVASRICFRQPGLPANDPRDRWRLSDGRHYTAAFAFEACGLERGEAGWQIAAIDDVLHVETSQQPDLAIFRLRWPDGARRPVPLGMNLDSAAAPAAEDVVYVIGHPIMDLQNDAANVALGLGTLDSTKRFAPGEIMAGAPPAILFHDCSTTNGSSGSPVVKLGSTAPVGLHYFGMPAQRNEAVLLPAYAAHPALRAALGGGWSI